MCTFSGGRNEFHKNSIPGIIENTPTLGRVVWTANIRGWLGLGKRLQEVYRSFIVWPCLIYHHRKSSSLPLLGRPSPGTFQRRSPPSQLTTHSKGHDATDQDKQRGRLRTESGVLWGCGKWPLLKSRDIGKLHQYARPSWFHSTISGQEEPSHSLGRWPGIHFEWKRPLSRNHDEIFHDLTSFCMQAPVEALVKEKSFVSHGLKFSLFAVLYAIS